MHYNIVGDFCFGRLLISESKQKDRLAAVSPISHRWFNEVRAGTDEAPAY